jgi:hypothetical protein
MPAKAGRDLEVAEDLEFQRRSWIAQRAGWVIMALVVFAAVAGLFGAGPLSSAQSGASNGLIWIEYERFGRLKAPNTLRIHFAQGAVRKGHIRIWIDRAYLQETKPERVLPEPQKVEVSGERLLYEFSAASDAGAGAISFELEPGSFGLIRGRLGLDGGDELRFRHFIFP